MKRETVLTLSTAVLAMVFGMTNNAQAKTPKSASSTPVPASADLQADAARMVGAQAGLVKPIDSKKIQQGQQIQFALNDKVQLKNGPELPKGTLLIGTATTGDAQAGGTSKLTLRFTEAKLKDGKSIPIKATIVGYFSTKSLERDDRNIWNPASLKVDQSGVTSGVDLHSNIVDTDSGVFVSTKGDSVKLQLGNWVALAIEAAPEGQQTPNGGI